LTTSFRAHGFLAIRSSRSVWTTPFDRGSIQNHEIPSTRKPEARHFHTRLLVQPSARLDVDLFARAECLLEHVAISVQPQDAIGIRGLVDKEARSSEDDVRHAFHPLEGVVDVAGGGEELVLARVQLLALLQVDRGDMPGAVTAEGNLARALRSST